MEQIPDAPYIREAERYGMPPYEVDEPDLSEQIKTLEDCDKGLDDVIDLLLNVEADLDGTEFCDGIRDVIRSIEDAGCNVRAARDILKRASK